jgi:hypothetical protein
MRAVHFFRRKKPMATFTVNPIFVVTEVCELDISALNFSNLDPNLVEKVKEVWAGACSMNTKPALVVSDKDIDAGELEELRRELRDEMKYPCK